MKKTSWEDLVRLQEMTNEYGGFVATAEREVPFCPDPLHNRYMACTTTLATGYALMALICNWVRCLVNKSWVFFLSNLVMAYLLVTSGSAVMEILYSAYKGDTEVTWSNACNTYGSFCQRLKIALLLHFLALFFALFFFLVLGVISAYRAFSVFEAPITTTITITTLITDLFYINRPANVLLLLLLL